MRRRANLPNRLARAAMPLLALALVGCTAAPERPRDAATAQASRPDAAVAAQTPARRVLLVSIDGLRPDAIPAAPAPTLMQLAGQGAHSWTARTIQPSITLPSHASMVSGHPADVHGILWNDWRPGYIPVPTVFSAAKARGLRTVMVVGKDKFEQLAIPGTVDTYIYAGMDDAEVAANAVVEARRGFDLMFVHFPLVDLTGHGTTWMSPEYLAQVAATDAHLGRLLAAIPADTTVIVTADHGGLGYIHWNDLDEDYTIPWIAAGPRVRRGHPIAAPIATTDTAATVAWLLGVSLPSDTIGRVVEEAFAP